MNLSLRLRTYLGKEKSTNRPVNINTCSRPHQAYPQTERCWLLNQQVKPKGKTSRFSTSANSSVADQDCLEARIINTAPIFKGLCFLQGFGESDAEPSLLDATSHPARFAITQDRHLHTDPCGTSRDGQVQASGRLPRSSSKRYLAPPKFTCPK